jgi:hypothetical protein
VSAVDYSRGSIASAQDAGSFADLRQEVLTEYIGGAMFRFVNRLGVDLQNTMTVQIDHH